jgi:tRNA 2-selenouridine synthase
MPPCRLCFTGDFVKFSAMATVSQLDQFDESIDVRSPSEFALDHLAKAVNLPVLDDAERAQVGTLYKQTSSFDAKKVGAALVARNIARHLDDSLKDRPKNWQPLVYCWRGGNRSASLAHVLRQIGWNAHALDGGYKAYRRHVIAELERLPASLQLRVVCGPTGSGKSRLLERIAERGGQVLDLEQLAAHRGSVLGNLPDVPQPSQKHFESKIWDTLRRFTSQQPVFVEAESVKIGRLRVPEALIARMWQSPCLNIQMPVAARVVFLTQEYDHFLLDLPDLEMKLRCLYSLHGRDKIEDWLALASNQRWPELVERLLVEHYDPAYRRSTISHFPTLDRAPIFSAEGIDDNSLGNLADEILLAELESN